MNFWFTINEGFKGFFRAKLSTSITITSIVFSHFLIAMFLLISLNFDAWIGDLRSKLELEIFISRIITSTETEFLHNIVSKIEGIENTRFISTDDAAKRFEEEFGQNIYNVLQSNPLPASIIATLKPRFQNAQGAAQITNEINKLNGIDDVIYQKDLITIVDSYMNIVYIVGLAVVLALVLITFILLYNTIRLTIYARRDIIEIMKLVGAKKSLIKRPFVIEGLLQGFIGALGASGFVYITVKLILKYVYPYLVFKIEIYGIIFLLALTIGFFSSQISVQKHLGEV